MRDSQSQYMCRRTRHFLIDMAVAIASTHCTYPRQDGLAELALVAWWRTVTHPSINY